MSKKTLPDFESEDEERDFWSNQDSAVYIDWSQNSRAALFEILALGNKQIAEGKVRSASDAIRRISSRRDTQ